MYLDDINKLPIIDKETAIEQLDDAQLFESMLMGFEEMSMRNNLTELMIALEKKDYVNVRLSSHSLKGASSYIHAERVKTLASNIQIAIDNKTNEDAFKYYPELVKQCIILKRQIRKEACTKSGKAFANDDSDFDVPIAKFFKIEKRSADDFDVVQISGNTDSTKKTIKEEEGIKMNEEAKSVGCQCFLL